MQDYDYEAVRAQSKLGGVMTCCMIFKVTFGVGVFTLPYAYARCGLVLGTVLCAAVFYMVTYGIDVLLGLCDLIEAEEGSPPPPIPRNSQHPGLVEPFLAAHPEQNSKASIFTEQPFDPDRESEGGHRPGSDRDDNIYTTQHDLPAGQPYELITYHQIPNRIKGKYRGFAAGLAMTTSALMCLGIGVGDYVYLIKVVEDLVDWSPKLISTALFAAYTLLLAVIVEPEKI